MLPPIQPGDPAPRFIGRTSGNPRYVFDSAAGRYVVLLFLGAGSQPDGLAALASAMGDRHRAMFDDTQRCLYAVSVDPGDQSSGRLRDQLPGLRILWDFELEASRLYRVVQNAAGAGEPVAYDRCWYVLDPMLRVLLHAPMRETERVLDFVAGLPPPERHGGEPPPAPVLVLPRLLEPELCRALIDRYVAEGGTESGFMQEEGGRTVGRLDARHKRRRDLILDDEPTKAAIRSRLHARLVPELVRSFQFHATYIERYIVACYDAAEGGHFAAHRDNTTKGTAHRRFAVSINLNDNFAGGNLRFPEFGSREYRPPVGGAVVFSCSLLHEATPVTSGVRYATLPFLYDHAAAKVREANLGFLGDLSAASGA